MSDSFVNLNEGIAGVGRVATEHADEADAHLMQGRRMEAASEGLTGRLAGPSGRGVRAIGMTRAATSGGMSRQSSDIAERKAEFAIEHAHATEDAYNGAATTYEHTSNVADNVMSARLNAG
ncbi:hypothetical protein [Solicola gregarius]|uniref:Uncharacterized protein n=1 Tax=Solicola gregarius TaxID=2908642 RepID=A0AA46TK00_9ACTN|nr:hypothetical protein [Solicola gregarius]UYM06289.1 hypothetical protein L0C25_04210 [Solicola gregarius]